MKTMMAEKARLNLGCGPMRVPGAFGVDLVNLGATDIIADLNAVRLPFRSGSISQIFAYHVLEHVDFIRLMDEFYRVLAPGGFLNIRVPHASSFGFWDDPTHRRPFTSRTFDYWDTASEHQYGFTSHFRVVRRRLNFLGHPEINRFKMLPWITNPTCKLLNFLGNLRIRFCERLWAHYVGGFAEVHFILTKT